MPEKISSKTKIRNILKQAIEPKLMEINEKLNSSTKYSFNYRIILNYLKYANYQFKSINSNEGLFLFAEKRKYIFKYIFELTFEIIFPSQVAIETQYRTEKLKHGQSIETEYTNPQKGKSLLDYSNISKSFIIGSDSNITLLYKNLDNDKFEINKIIKQILKPVNDKVYKTAIFIDTDYNKYYTAKYGEDVNKKDIKDILKLDGIIDYKFFEKKNNDYLIEKLVYSLGKTSEDIDRIKEETKRFNNGQGYIVNLDNLFKIILIHQKIQIGIPVLLMGETGCGKTYLLEYYAKVLNKDKIDFEKMVLHAGVKKSELISLLNKKIILAKKFLKGILPIKK